MGRHWKILIAVVAVMATIGLASLPALLRSVLRLQRQGVSEEQARRELSQPAITTPTDSPQTAHLFWARAGAAAGVEPADVQMPLSADPVQRSKQLIAALVSRAPSPAQRTLPADTELLQFYLLSDGTAVADFSEALSMETPSGILTEQNAVDSLVRTLAENVAAVHRLKILIRGQEADTLAGHLDLTGFFAVVPVAPPAPPPSAASADPPPAIPAALGQAKPSVGSLTPSPTPAASPAPAATRALPAPPSSTAAPAKTP